jgi:hypothetical protein
MHGCSRIHHDQMQCLHAAPCRSALLASRVNSSDEYVDANNGRIYRLNYTQARDACKAISYPGLTGTGYPVVWNTWVNWRRRVGISQFAWLWRSTPRPPSKRIRCCILQVRGAAGCGVLLRQAGRKHLLHLLAGLDAVLGGVARHR